MGLPFGWKHRIGRYVEVYEGARGGRRDAAEPRCAPVRGICIDWNGHVVRWRPDAGPA